MNRIIIVLLFFFIGKISLSAQEPVTMQPQQEQKKEKKKKSKKEKKSKLQDKDQMADSSQYTNQTDVVFAMPPPPADPTQARKTDERVKRLEAQLAERDQTLADLRRELNETLQRERALQKRVEEGDFNTLTLVYYYLEKPYDAKVTADAQRRLAAITTPSLDEDRKQFQKLYSNYAQYYKEVLELLRVAGSDVQMQSPLSAQQTAQQYIRRLQQTEYYINCYKKNSRIPIPFLDNVIDEATQRLRSHNPQAGRIAKFGDLFQQKK